MPISQKQFNPQLYGELLKAFAEEHDANQRPGVTPSAQAANQLFAYQPNTAEQQSEQDTIDEQSKRINDEMAADQKIQESNRAARDQLGLVDNSHPQRQLQQEAQAQERYKSDAPVREQHEKGLQEQELQKQNFDRLQKMFGVGRGDQTQFSQPTGPSGQPTGSGGSTSMNPPPGGSPPIQHSQSWASTISGKGAQRYSSLSDLLNAKSERMKYSMGIPTPLSAPIQETEFAKLEQIQGMFPGVRGIQGLIPVFRQHQTNMGNEMPSGTYQRLQGMEHMVREAMDGLNDPSARWKMSANGQLQMAVTPQSIERSKIALQDTLQKITNARQYMDQIYPGIGGPSSGGSAPPSGKTYLDDQGNEIH